MSSPLSDTTRETHESYGTIEVNRVSGRAYLFDSDVEHNNYIIVRLRRATRDRHLSNNWIHSGDVLAEFAMTELQWAHHLSHLNQGGGTPVTLRYVGGEEMNEPPEPVREETKFKAEVTATIADALKNLNTAHDRLKAATTPGAKALTKNEQKELLGILQTAVAEMTNSVPFVLGQFEEKVEKTITEAKAEFEGWMENRIGHLGLNAAQLAQAKIEAPALLTDGEEPISYPLEND